MKVLSLASTDAAAHNKVVQTELNPHLTKFAKEFLLISVNLETWSLRSMFSNKFLRFLRFELSQISLQGPRKLLKQLVFQQILENVSKHWGPKFNTVDFS